ncbi:MAG: hypothetical protein RL346_1393 [Verrucomicrobiota bacterium]|jgi:hypothetical protein
MAALLGLSPTNTVLLAKDEPSSPTVDKSMAEAPEKPEVDAENKIQIARLLDASNSMDGPVESARPLDEWQIELRKQNRWENGSRVSPDFVGLTSFSPRSSCGG